MSTYVGNEVFEMVKERGWRRGMGNLLQGELSSWFKSSRWLKHSLTWILSINLILLFTIMGEEAAEAGAEIPETIMLYGIFGGMFVMIGVMIILQSAIVGEKKSGTAAWVLSKPVSRTSFVVSKLIGYTAGVLVTAVLLPGLIAYAEIGLLTSTGWIPPLDFFAGVAVLGLHTFFWLTLTLMLGAFFDSVAAVIAIPIVLAFGQQYLYSLMPFLLKIAPWGLAAPVGSEEGEIPSIAVSIMSGTAPFSRVPILAAVVFSAVFIAVAIWRFNRQEF
jgi:ABC-2 type transport system permease protein